ncbi:unnamed protein product [Brachionus calyciflorus]|uniref:G-protein coupled receptors family 1 profile domain-containing protein n=1 Tax=Brachionus calyciflorus TaxID=104777 RepID=A0A814KQ00_9BILA|nr:unnamed protein product [Brachionus calyciflorus]
MEPYVISFLVSMSCVTVIGFLGNVIVIVVYLFDRNLKSTTNYLFVNLSITDILIVLTCFPVGILDLINEGEWRLGELICLSDHFIENLLTSVSSLTLISISLERFYATMFPLHVRIVNSKKNLLALLIGIWLTSALISTPFISFTTYREENYNGTIISYCYNDRSLFYKIYSSTSTSLFVFAPSFILSAVYLIIIQKLKNINSSFEISLLEKTKRDRRSNFSISKSSSCSIFYSNKKECENYDFRKTSSVSFLKQKHSIFRNSSTSYLIAKRKQTITICLISLAFFFCQIPLKIFQLFNFFYKFESTTIEKDLIRFRIMNFIFLTTKFLYFLHGMSNPIIYNLMSTKFRRSFRKAVLCKL